MKNYTATNLTDDDLHSLREALLKESDNQFTGDVEACGNALSEHPNPDFRMFLRTVGRERCADLLNMRAMRCEIDRLRGELQRIADLSAFTGKMAERALEKCGAIAEAALVE